MRSCSLRALLAALLIAATGLAETELRFTLRSEPKTLNPVMVDEEFSEIIRYLTGGVLIRLNRLTQQLEPELAESWALSKDARTVTLNLRKGVKFSDGSPFDSADVLHTFRLMFAPDLHSPTGDPFRIGGTPPVLKAAGPYQLTIQFTQPVPGVGRLLDQVAIMSSRSKQGFRAVLGPYLVADQKQGVSMVLRRNPNYWKHDAQGRALPLIDALRIGFQSNRELEALAFRRSETDLISTVSPQIWEGLEQALPQQAVDIGPSLDQEFLWFNQAPAGKVAPHKRDWFRLTAFRKAVSLAINRADLCRIAYRGHAIPATGPVPPSNKAFYNAALKPHPYNVDAAKKLLASAGFRFNGTELRDSKGNPVAFTIMTNGDNRARVQMAALVQRDLKAIGIGLNIVTLDFPALIERITRTSDYESCLFGLVTADPDPSYQMNVWLSSSANHQWSPNQPKPETPWEGEIDKLMDRQATAASEAERRTAFNRVQEIIYEQEPFVYLVHPSALAAVSPVVKGVKPTILRPQLLWNVESLSVVRGR